MNALFGSQTDLKLSSLLPTCCDPCAVRWTEQSRDEDKAVSEVQGGEEFKGKRKEPRRHPFPRQASLLYIRGHDFTSSCKERVTWHVQAEAYSIFLELN